jgi:hypothetical protein
VLCRPREKSGSASERVGAGKLREEEQMMSNSSSCARCGERGMYTRGQTFVTGQDIKTVGEVNQEMTRGATNKLLTLYI